MTTFFDRMRCLISHGADVNYPEICKFLMNRKNSVLELRRHSIDAFLGSKRVITLHTFNRLRGLGFGIDGNDCVIIDVSDDRTNFQYR